MSSFLFRRSAAAASAAAARPFSTSAPRSVARVSIVGNLADTPECFQTASGREIIRYAVASNSGPRDNRQTSWFRVASFNSEGRARDFMLSLPKGTQVWVEGDISIGQYTDANGQNQRNVNIVQRSLEILRRPQSAEQQQSQEQQSQEQQE